MPTLIEALKLVFSSCRGHHSRQLVSLGSQKGPATNLPWYSVYFSPPGLLILAALLTPVLYWLARH